MNKNKGGLFSIDEEEDERDSYFTGNGQPGKPSNVA